MAQESQQVEKATVADHFIPRLAITQLLVYPKRWRLLSVLCTREWSAAWLARVLK